MTHQPMELKVYQGQFGEFTITQNDRTGVVIYRASLLVAAVCFALGSGLALWQGSNWRVLQALTPLFAVFGLGMGVSLLTIHIYLLPLHRLLQGFWAIGMIAAAIIGLSSEVPLAVAVYQQPLNLVGVGFVFAALTGIFFKEAFCFNRLETKLLTPLVPLLLMGHLLQGLPLQLEQGLLGIWAAAFLIFAIRKLFQDIPSDIGDKSVFAYLKRQRSLTT